MQQRSSVRSLLVPGKRRTLNRDGILLAWFGPWILFVIVLATSVFRIRYDNPGLVDVVFACALISSLIPWYMGVKSHEHPARIPTWFYYLAAACAGGVFFGWIFGGYTYAAYMRPYFDWQGLNVYPPKPHTNVDGIDPASKGQAVIDAGVIFFAPGTYVDRSKALSFRNVNQFCVAPITGPNQTGNYDFWAVGKDCCDGVSTQFHCGDIGDPTARSGLRLLRDIDRPYFRLATQQAEAKFGISALHPIFLTWTTDADRAMERWYSEGNAHFWRLVGVGFCVSLFMTVLAAIVFSRVGSLPKVPQ
mmetsp:Transcript_57542/g.130493  ORF Transcript_57542/g.130493 Transcript_57542/m.130493 type:complete len:304 (+) Transcript_57542:92-1003(+)|eukprot:CAMPEP_0204276100 /NCGR_PEP_ID=MMETSP0468-20130131/27317_1 /ASSEMBLY_ACC=CAM_ASM_000383 /TAXON_ID=2969 /ORGANISM="Oxyrrhis marina" /LENGTH=303 /DNA_ID=CAMNT_0051252607 /DNA_START=86 /DNA_END=997 /DNA_ORIENTATION=-